MYLYSIKSLLLFVTKQNLWFQVMLFTQAQDRGKL